MKRGGPIKRNAGVPKRNAKRQAKRRAADDVYGSFFRYVATLPCAVMGEGDDCEGKVTGHHIKSVGAGGKDAGNLTPLCVRHHRMIHDIGPKRFDERFFNSMPLYAEMIWRRYCDGFESDNGANEGAA